MEDVVEDFHKSVRIRDQSPGSPRHLKVESKWSPTSLRMERKIGSRVNRNCYATEFIRA
jgi:hypothetical protein